MSIDFDTSPSRSSTWGLVAGDEQPDSWREDALCRQIDCGDIFFVDKGESTQPAKAICALCPVTAECLAYALERDERFGVWGGFSERERRQLTRHRPRSERRGGARLNARGHGNRCTCSECRADREKRQ